MYSFLNKVSLELLRDRLRPIIPVTVRSEVAALERAAFYSVLYSLKGFDILSDQPVRCALLESLPPERLQAFAEELGISSIGKPYDLAVALSNLPWKPSSKLSSLLAETFSIPMEFLPTQQRHLQAIEFVDGYKPPLPLFDYQLDLVQQITKRLANSEPERFLVQLPTGAGKTRTLVEALTDFYTTHEADDVPPSTLWLAHAEELCEQAIDAFRLVWRVKDLPDFKIIRYYGAFNPPILEADGAFVVGTFQKIASALKGSAQILTRIRAVTRIIVVDEAHKALAQTGKDIIDWLTETKKCHLVGLTATPGRTIDPSIENVALARLFNQTLLSSSLLSGNAIRKLQSRGILARIQRVAHQSHVHLELSQQELDHLSIYNEVPSTLLKRLASNKARNELIVSLVLEEKKAGNATLVFTCTVEHARELALRCALKGVRASCIDCEMPRTLRRRIVTQFKSGYLDTLFNFGVLSTGFDAPNIRTIIIARPTSSVVLYSQMLGRGLRGERVGGSEHCRVIDVKDNFENFGDLDKIYDSFVDFWKKPNPLSGSSLS